MHILIKQSQWNWLLLLDVEYTYVEEQYCAGDYIGTFSSLEAAKAACKINSDCQCIHDSSCGWDMDVRTVKELLGLGGCDQPCSQSSEMR